MSIDLMYFIVVFKNHATALISWLSTSITCCLLNYAYAQSVAKKGDFSNSSNYRPMAYFLAYHEFFFKQSLNKNIIYNISSSNFVSDGHY